MNFQNLLLAADGVDRHHAVEAGDIDPSGAGAGGNPFDVFRFLAGRNRPGRNAPDEAIIVVDIEYQDTDAAMLLVITDAGLGNVEQVLGGEHGGRK